jgi:hypothetical protein
VRELRIAKLQPTKRLENEGSLYAPSKNPKTLVVGDLTEYNGKVFRVFAKSPAGLLTLQNTQSGQIPASLVLTQKQATGLIPLMRVIKT